MKRLLALILLVCTLLPLACPTGAIGTLLPVPGRKKGPERDKA